MTSNEWPPNVVAMMDQFRALLHTMVGWKLEHDAEGDCKELCPGGEVQELLNGLHKDIVDVLAALMVCELAKLGYNDRTPR